MDTRIANTAHPDIVMIESMNRPTPTPTRVSFSQVLAQGVSNIVQGAELAASKLPGSPITAAAVRGGMTPMSAQIPVGGAVVNATAEGPTGAGSLGAGVGLGMGVGVGMGGVGGGIGTAGTDPGGSIDASLQQAAQMNLYYLQIQQT